MISDFNGQRWTATGSRRSPSLRWVGGLFLDHEEQVPARWPNAGFDDETVFNRSYWAEGTLTGGNDAYTLGWLQMPDPKQASTPV